MTQATLLPKTERLSLYERARAKDRLVAELIKGQIWLTETSDTLLALPDAGVGSKLEAQFLHGLDVWDHLDYMLRFVYGYTLCIHGLGAQCPKYGGSKLSWSAVCQIRNAT